MTERNRCANCNSPRAANPCPRCGTPTELAHHSWEEPQLPPIDLIRKLAFEVGYAIGEHGSKERDLDVIAAPWVDTAVTSPQLLTHLANGLDARIVEVEDKPLGRTAATLLMRGWYRPLDISVCPMIESPTPTAQKE